MPAQLEHANYTVADPQATAAWMEKLFAELIELKMNDMPNYRYSRAQLEQKVITGELTPLNAGKP